MKDSLAIGVDIGGTHITCAAVDIAKGRLLTDTLFREAYDHQADAQRVLHSWAKALNHTLLDISPADLVGIGFAIPGPFDYRNGISKMQHKFPALYDVHIPSVLNPLLVTDEVLPMRFLNDATCLAIGETWQGEGRNFQKVVVITLGTGFGSAFVKQGIPITSGEAVPGEGCLWHLPFQSGIADDYFSTRWFVAEFQKQTGVTISSVKELMQMTDRHDQTVSHLFAQFGQHLADCLSPWLQRFEAEVLIIGGNIAHALSLFVDDLQQGLHKSGVHIPVVPSALMEHAALLGSARLMDNLFWQRVSVELPHI